MRYASTLLLSLALAGCIPRGPREPGPEPASPWVFASTRPEAGSFAFAVDDSNDALDVSRTVDLAAPGELAQRTSVCVPELEQTSATPASEGLPLALRFDCYYDDQIRLIVRARGLPDPRRWQVGEFAVELPAEQVEVSHLYQRTRGRATTCTSHPAVTVQIAVEEAVGSGEPGSAFSRRFTLALDLDDVRGEPWERGGRRPCPLIDLSLRGSYRVTDASYRR